MSIPPPYAPASNLSHPSYNFVQQRSIKLDQEIKLYESKSEKELYESLSEIYSILVVLEMVEKSYIKDVLQDKDEYTNTVLRLLNQYNIILKNHTVQERFVSLDNFSKTYNISCPLAINRIDIGIPATLENATLSIPEPINSNANSIPSGNTTSAKAVAEATGNFITCMDALKLNYRTKEQLHPLLSDLITSINDVFEKEFPSKSKIIQWLIKLNGLRIEQELSEEEVKTVSKTPSR